MNDPTPGAIGDPVAVPAAAGSDTLHIAEAALAALSATITLLELRLMQARIAQLLAPEGNGTPR
jgi:hypothetical protein